ncbi:MAG: hypothetical protein JM58_00415 [Peptococcaceae bacterium BICA1-8]|nr:MAG: hypothetical protein JM58_00415 [Peptococcaceae bacterium BICA1-8]
MKITYRLLVFALVCSVVITGLIILQLDNSIESQFESAIMQGYPGTTKADVKLKINWLQDGIQGNIANLTIDINDWRHGSLQINNFYGDFSNVQINWLQLFRKKQIVVEKIGKGNILAVIDESNLNKMINRYYQGLTVKLEDNEVNVNLNLKILSYTIRAIVHGTLIPGTGPELYFVPGKIDIGKYELSENIRQDLLERMKIPLSLEKIPFTFHVTTVKIMQNKIIIEGKV